MRSRLTIASALVVAGLLAAATPAQCADMTKTLRVALPVAETGFDPQVTSDIYSSAIIAAIVDPL